MSTVYSTNTHKVVDIFVMRDTTQDTGSMTFGAIVHGSIADKKVRSALATPLRGTRSAPGARSAMVAATVQWVRIPLLSHWGYYFSLLVSLLSLRLLRNISRWIY
jgi:hypothetical protein